MSILTLIVLFLIKTSHKYVNSLDSISKGGRNRLSFCMNTPLLRDSLNYKLKIESLNFKSNLGYDKIFTKSCESIFVSYREAKLFSLQGHVLVHSKNNSKGCVHYNHLFSDKFTNLSEKFSSDHEKDSFDDEESFEDSDKLPSNEIFFNRFINNLEDQNDSSKLNWKHPMPCCVSQMAALSCVRDLVPPSLISECFDIKDDTKLDDIISTKLGPYYTTLNYDLFFKYKKDFCFERDGTEVVKSEIKPLIIEKPDNPPIFESDKPSPSIPLGWRSFVVLGLYDSPNYKGIYLNYIKFSDDPSLYWFSKPLSDGDPPPRISSGLFKYGDEFNFVVSRDAIKPDGSLLYSKDPISPGEYFSGEKGDMSTLYCDTPEEYKSINENVYKHMISEDGVWFKKHFENVIGTLTLLQAVWARLSTTILKSTSKVLKLYRLKTRKLYSKVKNKLDVLDYYKNKKNNPVEFNLGLLYFMTAPTLHHALQFVCSDPVARSNLYKNLLIFEADDVLKDKLTIKRDTDLQNPREYLILGRFSQDEPVNLLSDRMLRFLIRSNCVKNYFQLRGPRKDNLHDFNLPLYQILPFKQYLRPMLLNQSIRNACMNKNLSLPIGDLSIITKYEFDEALEWARRNPYTRSGSYDSLFVTMAYELGFYNQNSKFVMPVPIRKQLIPSGKEYVTVNRDPIKILSDRMKQSCGHILTVPHNISKLSNVFKKNKYFIKNEPKFNGDHLKINVKKSISNDLTSENISKLISSKKQLKFEFQSKGPYSIILPNKNILYKQSDSCYVKTFLEFPLNPEQLEDLLDQNAPKELDKPFYAKYLKDFVYVSLPEGHFFEPLYKYDIKGFNSGEPGEFDSNVGAEEMLLLDEYKVKPISGFWIKKNEFYIFKNRNHLVIVYNKYKNNNPIDIKFLKGILLKDEVYMDLINKGGTKDRIDVSNSYTIHNNRLVSHLTEEEKIKTAFTVYPLNRYNYKFSSEDDIPYSRFYEKHIDYGKDDPRTLMSYYPDKLYQIHLDFINKLDKGIVSIEDDPLKIMVEGDYEFNSDGNSVSTWEDQDKNLLSESNS